MDVKEQLGCFIDAARMWIGTPWRHQGRTKTGIDCVGLVVLAANTAGIPIDDPIPYTAEANQIQLRAGLETYTDVVKPPYDDGDIVLIEWDKVRGPSHIAIVASYVYGGSSIVHSAFSGTVEQPIDERIFEKIVAGYRIKEKLLRG